MGQRFIARERFDFPNGAIGYSPGGAFDCLGPYAKVVNCPIKLRGTDIDMFTMPDGSHEFVDTRVYAVRRYTCYASGYADTFFSIPASTKIRGKNVSGFFTTDDDDGVEFVAYDRHVKTLLGE